MKRRSSAIALTFLAYSSFSHAYSNKNTITLVNSLDESIPKLLNSYYVPGAAVAIIKDGKVAHLQGYGFSDIKKKKKVDLKTGFNVGSISKTVAAWGVMQLVEQGQLSLDEPVTKYLTRWQLPKSEYDIDGVTIRRLLSHTAGLSLHGYPGWGPSDILPTIEESLSGENNGPGDVRLIMEPGTKWKYSGGGYTLCQLIIEEVTGLTFSNYMRKNIFKPLGMHNSDYEITNKTLLNSSLAYDSFGDETPSPLFTAKAAAGLHTTIDDLSLFVLAGLKTTNTSDFTLLMPSTIKEMLTPVLNGGSRYGLGYGSYKLSNNKTAYGHGGANRGWRATFSIVPETGDGIIVTTNGSNGEHIYQSIVCQWEEWLTNITPKQSCIEKKPIQIELAKLIKTKSLDAAITQYHKIKKTNPQEFRFDEWQLNTLGFQFINKKDFDAAIKILTLNTIEYPNIGNTFDSLAEAYMLKGDKALAIKHYKKALQLDPKNAHAKQMINKLSQS